MIKQKTFIILKNNNSGSTSDGLESKINEKLDKFLEEIQEKGHAPLSVSVSSKDDVPTQHCFVATIMYRENYIRKVITEKNNDESATKENS